MLNRVDSSTMCSMMWSAMNTKSHCMASLKALLTLVLCTARSVGRFHWRHTRQVSHTEAIMSSACFGAPAVESRLCMRREDACHQRRCSWRSDLASRLLLPERNCLKARPRSKLDQSTGSAAGTIGRECASGGNSISSPASYGSAGSTGSTGCGMRSALPSAPATT